MAGQESKNSGQPPLVDSILQCGKPAFDPSLPEETRLPIQREFAELIKSTTTLALLPVLNLLVQPDRVHPWLRAPIIAALARLPLRPRGVQHTIEFILSVHPTTAGANAQPAAGRGAAISYDALNAASRLLSSPPAGMNPDDWFQGIAPQLFSLLQGEGELEMDRAAAFVIGFGVLGRRQYGAPGTAGWKAFVEPIFRSIDPSLIHSSTPSSLIDVVTSSGVKKIISSTEELSKGLQRLSTLLFSHPNPALSKRLLKPLLFPLWALSSWSVKNEQTEKAYIKPAKSLLKTLVQLSTKDSPSKEASNPTPSTILTEILDNILFNGRRDPKKLCWSYAAHGDGIEIHLLESSPQEAHNYQDFTSMDVAVDSFIALLASIFDLGSEISALFLQLFGKWISNNDKDTTTKIITQLEIEDNQQGIESKYIEAKVMQRMMSEFPDKLVDNSMQVLQVCNQVLSGFLERESEEEDTSTLALSLLNIILTAPSFRPTPQTEAILASIESSLESIGRKPSLETSQTAQNLLLLLRFRTSMEESTSTPSSATDQQVEDRKSYALGMSYLTATDSPPPVRAQGLEIISSLVRSNSTILNIPALQILFTTLLQDPEEYIHLRAITSITQLSQRHPKTVMKDLIDRYVDPNEEADLDQRLRLGEALLRVIQTHPLSFTSDTARTVIEGLIYISSRRGYRAKTLATQQKQAHLKQQQDQEAEQAWDGPVPQLDEVLDIEPQYDEELMTAIVTGWESRRGMEDVRIRASALSILGSALEANVSSLSPTLMSTTIDLSLHILTLEPEIEKAILRRAAILLILAFVEALDKARDEGRKLAFGFVEKSLSDVRRVVGFVESVDSDHLVRGHARVVVEGLEAWEMRELVGNAGGERGSLLGVGELAGLEVRNGFGGGSRGGRRPRIEEVE